MRLGELLQEGRIQVPLTAGTLEGALETLLGRTDPGLASTGRPTGANLVRALEAGEVGSVQRPTPRSWFGTLREGRGVEAVLGVSPEPLGPGADSTRIVLLLRIGSGSSLRPDGVRRIGEALADPRVEEALLAAESADDVHAIGRLAGIGLAGALRVADALTPLSYRIYPDTPLSEVVDLMARRGLPAVPVVGEGLQVLGLIRAGDALRHALQIRAGPDERRSDRPGATARDIMTRSVLCVTEQEDLTAAAKMMVARDAPQLPVVREGEIVGFLTREAVLRALFGGGREGEE